jgi:hypothetical protein
VTPEQVGLPRDPEPFIELWFGDLNHPDLGKSLLGDNGWTTCAQLKEGESAFFLIRTAGAESFKGSGFVRGGITTACRSSKAPTPSPSVTSTPTTSTASKPQARRATPSRRSSSFAQSPFRPPTPGS